MALEHATSRILKAAHNKIIAADGAGEQGDVRHPREFLSDVRQE
jgi:hypothetical protein